MLWQFVHGVRTSVEWVKDVPTTSGEWHTLRLNVDGQKVEGYLDGKKILTHTLPAHRLGTRRRVVEGRQRCLF